MDQIAFRNTLGIAGWQNESADFCAKTNMSLPWRVRVIRVAKYSGHLAARIATRRQRRCEQPRRLGYVLLRALRVGRVQPAADNRFNFFHASLFEAGKHLHGDG